MNQWTVRQMGSWKNEDLFCSPMRPEYGSIEATKELKFTKDQERDLQIATLKSRVLILE